MMTEALSVHSQDRLTDTWVTPLRRPAPSTNRGACLVHIYPTGAGMGTRYVLGGQSLTIGRGSDCEIRISDHSVSRQHVRIEPAADGFQIVDLQSTNGTFVNDTAVSTQILKDGDYLRVGNCIYRFLAGGNLEAEYHEEIYRLTIIDALTEVHNKRYLLEFLDRELSRSARYHRPLSLILFDLDHFKAINDAHGHLAGDFVLRELAGYVRTIIRKEELFARYGGEEFAVVLPECNLEVGVSVAERVRGMVAKRSFEFEGNSFQLTVSLGIACTTGEEPLSPTDLLRMADYNLHQAKRGGRNQLVA